MEHTIERVDYDNAFPVSDVTIVDSTDQVAIGALGDMHVGNKAFNESKFKQVINWIQQNNALWIGMGDWMENASKVSIGEGWMTQKMTPQEQVEYLTDTIAPIASRCIGVIQGNHEFRTERLMGIDPMSTICFNLKLPYYKTILFATIASKRISGHHPARAYSLIAMHTTMSSKTAGLDENAIERDVSRYFSFDIIAKAHGHYSYLSEPKPYYTMDMGNRRVIEKERRVWSTGAYLDWKDSYAMTKPYGPIKPGVMALWLNFDNTPKRIRGEEL